MADEWVLKTGIIQETKMVEFMITMYSNIALWARQWKNISVQYVDIEKANLQKALDEGLPESVDWLFFPCEMPLFSTDRSPESPGFSLTWQPTSMYMLSATPLKKTVPSMQFLEMQYEFIIYLLTSWIIISALMSFIECFLCLGIIWTSIDFGKQFLENLWRNILLFFFEPFISTPRILSWRILVSVWLIAVSFIYVEMSGNLKSKFTETEYGLVDSLADLPLDRYGDVVVLKDFIEEAFVNKMAEIDDDYRELTKRMSRVDEVEFAGILFSGLDKGREFVIVAENTGKIAVKEASTLTTQVPPRGLISFSKPLYNTFVVFPIARNASSRTVDAINGITLLEMESKILAKYFNEIDFLFFGMRWTKPVETFEDLTFDDIKSVVNLFLFGSLFAFLIFIVEFSALLIRETFYRG